MPRAPVDHVGLVRRSLSQRALLRSVRCCRIAIPAGGTETTKTRKAMVQYADSLRRVMFLIVSVSWAPGEAQAYRAMAPSIRASTEQGRVGGGRGSCRSRESLLPAAFAPCAGASVSALAPFPAAAHRTGLADLPHPALGRELHERACAGLRARRVWWMSITPIFPWISAYPKRLVPLTRSLCRRERKRRTPRPHMPFDSGISLTCEAETEVLGPPR